MSLAKDIKSILVNEQQIKEICERLGKEITNDYKSKERPIMIGLLKGCVPFLSDLARHIDLPIEIEYMDVSSYHGGISSSGDVKIRKDMNTSVAGRDILIAEDIVDTGRTLDTIVKLLKHRGAKSVEIVTLLDKPAGRVIPFEPKYVGVTIPKEFVVGYGLDYEEIYRNLPYVGILKPEIYTK
ncbi:MAG: hypoxanthine phosphoribosyltransferase [Paracholeplasma sp.]|jgi:hypoxanthine phosphoribosyltransferase/bifunctional protein TilS/HprT|uniref:Hypoxanthine phosphoribosyltransferase n=1 Tax=Acholeplasma brassicae TaxID=61635 RepID=U4KQD4_9MOLU|nr:MULTISPECIES: hypoxanthine phosphoribosyltransferase [Paracholeplasma]MDY3196555.1 hypoxanthine phosphoribosyltransferase [Paracholeplasma sp.]CCV66656.1 Hypoxanthine-guanine phosphoribosyltransferase [Paracholeplasma brassicae]